MLAQIFRIRRCQMSALQRIRHLPRHSPKKIKRQYIRSGEDRYVLAPRLQSVSKHLIKVIIMSCNSLNSNYYGRNANSLNTISEPYWLVQTSRLFAAMAEQESDHGKS
jgi:hypothetical protein